MGQVNLRALNRMRKIATSGTVDQILHEAKRNRLFSKTFPGAYHWAITEVKKINKRKSL